MPLWEGSVLPKCNVRTFSFRCRPSVPYQGAPQAVPVWYWCSLSDRVLIARTRGGRQMRPQNPRATTLPNGQDVSQQGDLEYIHTGGVRVGCLHFLDGLAAICIVPSVCTIIPLNPLRRELWQSENRSSTYNTSRPLTRREHRVLLYHDADDDQCTARTLRNVTLRCRVGLLPYRMLALFKCVFASRI